MPLREDPEVIRCICSRPHTDSGFMIQCDDCDMWVHARCYRLNRQTVPEGKFHCKQCLRKTPPSKSPATSLDADTPSVTSDEASPSGSKKPSSSMSVTSQEASSCGSKKPNSSVLPVRKRHLLLRNCIRIFDVLRSFKILVNHKESIEIVGTCRPSNWETWAFFDSEEIQCFPGLRRAILRTQQASPCIPGPGCRYKNSNRAMTDLARWRLGMLRQLYFVQKKLKLYARRIDRMIEIMKEEFTTYKRMMATKKKPKIVAPKKKPTIKAPKTEPTIKAPKTEPTIKAPKKEPTIKAPKKEPTIKKSPTPREKRSPSPRFSVCGRPIRACRNVRQ